MSPLRSSLTNTFILLCLRYTSRLSKNKLYKLNVISSVVVLYSFINKLDVISSLTFCSNLYPIYENMDINV